MNSQVKIVAILLLLLGSGCEESLNNNDTPGAVDAAFQWVIGERRLPELALLENQGRTLFVLEQNIQLSWITPPEGKDLIFLDHDQLLKRARQGDFLYVAFDELSLDETGHVDIVMGTRWAVAPDSRSLRLSGGSVKLRVSKRWGRWFVEEDYRMIALVPSFRHDETPVILEGHG